jgi:2-keto-4-pentenoate hydratase/2-oxohepta-3-ene-1,7-dioic acid hydratase in catechol pathway
MTFSLLSFADGDNFRAGISVDDKVIDLAKETGDNRFIDVGSVLADWRNTEGMLTALAAQARGGSLSSAGVPLDEVRLGPPLVPGSIFGAGANYTDHIEEMARVLNMPIGMNEKGKGHAPWHFVKTSRNTVVGPDDDIELPAFSDKVDYELELVAIIGKRAKDVSVADALEYVAGYTIGNDLSAREPGPADVPVGSPFHLNWITIKCFDGSCPLGPWIVPASQIADPQHLALKLWVNDELRQDSNTGLMIFTVAEQIAQLSTRVTLQPGDAIMTGTPAGVALPDGRFLKRGDTVRMWIEGIGEMRNTFT